MNGFHSFFDTLKSITSKTASNKKSDDFSVVSDDEEEDIFDISFSDLSLQETTSITTTARYERRRREQEIMTKYKLYTEDEYGNKTGRLRVTDYSSL